MPLKFDPSKLKHIRDVRVAKTGKRKSTIDMELAAQTGVSHSTFNAWRYGRTEPLASNVIMLAKACQVDPEYFYSWTSEFEEIRKVEENELV